MARDRYCPLCNQSDHHRPDCAEMSFPSGRRRGDPGAMPPLRPVDPERALPLHAESPLGEEMAGIFAGLTEAMLKRHLAEQRAIHGEPAR